MVYPESELILILDCEGSQGEQKSPHPQGMEAKQG